MPPSKPKQSPSAKASQMANAQSKAKVTTMQSPPSPAASSSPSMATSMPLPKSPLPTSPSSSSSPKGRTVTKPASTTPSSPSSVKPSRSHKTESDAGASDHSEDESDSDSDDSDTLDSDDDFSGPGMDQVQARLAKFSSLRARIRQTENDNRKDLVAAQGNRRLPASVQRKLERKRAEALELLQKRELEANGQDFQRHKNLNYSAQDVESWDQVQTKKRQRANVEFIDPTEGTHKRFKKLGEALKADHEAYDAQRATAAVTGDIDSFYGDLDGLDVAAKPGARDVDRMVADLNKQIEIAAKSSRRRMFNPDEDVSYINDKNRKFNERAGRAYDKYTQEIKESLERGTAL
ncbi:SYF2 splicing factor-domain-containing protein [Catenaria anguillulae PL171]|uniref:Pre-mRNA-splicing factor SYF2 n=1 Tax=Catenaria anguillulae PL171 TaxID=765915 RepID=A0A1Y2I069_9FUNG|nr:SYF2 splicing factor-domain-containing protein [Catenaria anguillulae PL171]